MSADDTSLIDYEELEKSAKRYVVRDVLELVAAGGETPGDHHFYVHFATAYPGVALPDYLREQYPDRMSIVLQHQYEDLAVDGDGFKVTLRFKGKPERLEIPWAALIGFNDPHAEYELRFEPAPVAPAFGGADPGDDAPSDPTPGDGAEVVSLDAFRKK